MKYTYLGVQTAIALPPEKEGDPPTEIVLQTGQEVDLPEDMDYVNRGVINGWLVPVPAPAAETHNRKSRKEAD